MTTPQWTIEGSELRYHYIPGAWCSVKRDDMRSSPEGDDAYEALVADVAAARLVDDMAAVVRRMDAGSRPMSFTDGLWWSAVGTSLPTRKATPGEVAALHHARQQEGT